MNYKHFKHFRDPFVLKMLIVQMNGYTLFLFSRQAAHRQQTQHSVCSEQRIYGEIWSTATKSTKNIAIRIYHASCIMGNLNFPHFQHNRIWKMRKMLKVHVPRIAEICILGFLHLLSHKKPKRCKSHTPKNMNYQHFRHNRSSIMLIMSIVHESATEKKSHISVYFFADRQ